MMKGEATLPKTTYPAMMKICEVIDECTNDTSPVLMQDCVNYEHEDSIRNYLVDKNNTKVND